MAALVFFGLDWPRLPGARGARELCSAMGSRLVPAFLGAFLLIYARLCCSEGPTTTTLLVRELSDDGKLLPTCSRAQRARVPVKPCTAGPCLTLCVSQAGWNLTSKLRPPGASLSSQYRPVRGTENPENLSPLGYGPSQSGHTGWRSGLRKGQQTHPPRQSITPNARGIFPTAKPAARAPGFATILLFAPWQLP
jgi:hypothetical protein